MISNINVYLDEFIPQWHNRLELVQYHILAIITEGSLIYHVNGQIETVRKGDIIFIPSGTHREAFNDKDILHQKYAITFQSDDSLNLPLFTLHKTQIMHTRHFDQLKERFSTLFHQHLEKKDFYETISTGIILEILGTLNRELLCPPVPKRNLQMVMMIEQYIVEHYREIISLRHLSEMINRSPNYTINLFKQVMAVTPVEFQHQLRINKAIELLQHTDSTVAAIADYLGYYDASSFHKMFRKKTGLPPSAYHQFKGTSGE